MTDTGGNGPAETPSRAPEAHGDAPPTTVAPPSEQAAAGAEAAPEAEAPLEASVDDPGEPGGRDPEVWRLVAVADVVMELPASYPEVVLQESQHPWRELRIPVGLAEGTAIAYAFRSVATPRPLTHEMLTEVLERHGVSIEAVRVTGRRGQAFHAEMDTTGPRGRQIVPCRPSDAIVLALRQRVPTPVLVAEWVFESAADNDASEAAGGAPSSG